MQKGICSSLCLHIHKPKFFPGFFKRKPPSSYMLSHHTWSPRAPLINVVAQCMPASEPKWLCLFLKPSKQSHVTTLNLGKGGMQVSSQWVWQDGCSFWRSRYLIYIYNIMLCNNNNIYIISKFIYTYNVRLCYNVLYMRICYLLKYMCIH